MITQLGWYNHLGSATAAADGVQVTARSGVTNPVMTNNTSKTTVIVTKSTALYYEKASWKFSVKQENLTIMNVWLNLFSECIIMWNPIKDFLLNIFIPDKSNILNCLRQTSMEHKVMQFVFTRIQISLTIIIEKWYTFLSFPHSYLPVYGQCATTQHLRLKCCSFDPFLTLKNSWSDIIINFWLESRACKKG